MQEMDCYPVAVSMVLEFRIFFLQNWLPPKARKPNLSYYLIHTWRKNMEIYAFLMGIESERTRQPWNLNVLMLWFINLYHGDGPR